MNRLPSRPCVAATLAAALLAISASCSNRLGSHRELLVGVPAAEAPAPAANELSVTYLGVNGYLLRSGSTALLVDPFFSRVPLREVVFRAPLASSPEDIAFGLEKGGVPGRVDAILVTHSHFDHALDVPALQRRLGGRVIASETGAALCLAAGLAPSAVTATAPGRVHRVGAATVRVLAARHDLVFGKVPYPGLLSEPPSSPPTRASHWLLGTPLAFAIEIGGRRVYVESGGVSGHPPSVADVDLAIVGTAVGDADRYAEVVRALAPRHVLPSHQDNFFNPLRSGFHFSALSDFPRIKAVHRGEGLPGELILMDYFHTWRCPY